MIFFANNDGTIVYSQPSPVHQGGANTNNIYLFAPFATNSSVTVGFLLPDGSIFPREGPALMTWRRQIPYTDEDGNLLSGWVYSMPNTVLQGHGAVTVQFLYYNAVGEIVASSSTSFNVEKGVPVILPAAPSQTIYQQILQAIAQLQENLDNFHVDPYILPIASAETLGGVRPVNKTAAMGQPVGVDGYGRLWTASDSDNLNLRYATEAQVRALFDEE